MTVIDSGIDYGRGRTNIDSENGIRYGVILFNDLAHQAWYDITSDGTDLDYADAIENLLAELASAIDSVLKDYATSYDKSELAQSIIDNLDFEMESNGGCTRYLYDSNGLTFRVCSDGDILVIESPYYTLCSYCSPCAPGAGHLRTSGSVKAYCLGPDWFDSDCPMPYECFKVSDSSVVS